ncbi:OLC1v1025369C1 [Oldenlandia corymbosa var. corymbosa]|uniref:OLC1v1025369C1 n=1 Tax=Oldenlandia corymbosa var. corymbosa TaxID=529605 RepID=A0AAV1C6Y1_OLDCO|nr:OLC1v1025369C1 [Oldenlandia corymbosa var. corymbosa]
MARRSKKRAEEGGSEAGNVQPLEERRDPRGEFTPTGSARAQVSPPCLISKFSSNLNDNCVKLSTREQGECSGVKELAKCLDLNAKIPVENVWSNFNPKKLNKVEKKLKFIEPVVVEDRMICQITKHEVELEVEHWKSFVVWKELNAPLKDVVKMKEPVQVVAVDQRQETTHNPSKKENQLSPNRRKDTGREKHDKSDQSIYILNQLGRKIPEGRLKEKVDSINKVYCSDTSHPNIGPSNHE